METEDQHELSEDHLGSTLLPASPQMARVTTTIPMLASTTQKRQFLLIDTIFSDSFKEPGLNSGSTQYQSTTTTTV